MWLPSGLWEGHGCMGCLWDTRVREMSCEGWHPREGRLGVRVEGRTVVWSGSPCNSASVKSPLAPSLPSLPWTTENGLETGAEKG